MKDFPTKTDIRGIKIWLNKSEINKQVSCPFNKGQIYPHWKCDLAFPAIVRKRMENFRKLGRMRRCPCDNYLLNYVIRVARKIVEEAEMW